MVRPDVFEELTLYAHKPVNISFPQTNLPAATLLRGDTISLKGAAALAAMRVSDPTALQLTPVPSEYSAMHSTRMLDRLPRFFHLKKRWLCRCSVCREARWFGR